MGEEGDTFFFFAFSVFVLLFLLFFILRAAVTMQSNFILGLIN